VHDLAEHGALRRRSRGRDPRRLHPPRELGADGRRRSRGDPRPDRAGFGRPQLDPVAERRGGDGAALPGNVDDPMVRRPGRSARHRQLRRRSAAMGAAQRGTST
jgi:hypothetical protein